MTWIQVRWRLLLLFAFIHSTALLRALASSEKCRISDSTNITKTKSAFQQAPQVVCMHLELENHVIWYPPSNPLPARHSQVTRKSISSFQSSGHILAEVFILTIPVPCLEFFRTYLFLLVFIVLSYWSVQPYFLPLLLSSAFLQTMCGHLCPCGFICTAAIA